MSSSLIRNLYNKEDVGVVTNDTDGLNDGKKTTEVYETDYVAVLTVANRTGGDTDGTVEHSPDGSNWETIATFTTLSADGIDAVSFGPMDYSLSSGIFDPGHADIKKLFNTVVKKAAEKNLQVLTAVGPTTLERVEELTEMGVRFLAMGADIAAIASSFGSLMQQIVLKTGRSTDTVVP